MMSFLFRLPDNLVAEILCERLDICDVGRLDSAVCSSANREQFLQMAYNNHGTPYKLKENDQFIDWCIQRHALVDGFNLADQICSNSKKLKTLVALNAPVAKWIYCGQISFLSPLEVLPYCERLNTLTVNGNAMMNAEAIACAVEHCPRLTRVVHCGSSTTAESIQLAFRKCTTVKELEFCGNIMNNQLTKVIAMHALEVLQARYSTIPEEVQLAIGRNCPNLRILVMFESSCGPFGEILNHSGTNDGVRAILNGCPLLTSIDVHHAVGISTELRVEMARRCKLTRLDMSSWTGLDTALFRGICMVSPLLEAAVQDASTELQSLIQLTDEDVTVLAEHCPLLHTIQLPGMTGLSHASRRALARPGNQLRRLVLHRNCADPSPSAADATMELVGARCPQLTAIVVPADTTDRGITAVARGCPNLKALGLSHCLHLTDVGLTAVAQHCRRLRVLELEGCVGITAAGVRVLRERYSRTELCDVFLGLSTELLAVFNGTCE